MPRPLSLYDTWERRLRPFTPLAPGGPVGLYTCGPTVYDHPHLGHARQAMTYDIVRRYLEWTGLEVHHAAMPEFAAASLRPSAMA